MGILAGRSLRTRASFHRTSIFDLVKGNRQYIVANEERSFTSTKLACHRCSLGSTGAIEWRDNEILLKPHESGQSLNNVERWVELTCSPEVL